MRYSAITRKNTLLTIENEELRKRIAELECELAQYKKAKPIVYGGLPRPLVPESSALRPNPTSASFAVLADTSLSNPLFGGYTARNQFPPNT